MSLVESESQHPRSTTTVTETLPIDLMFMEVLQDLLRLFVTEQQIQQFLQTLGVHFSSCVVDANIWLVDLMRTLKTGKPSGLLLAARIGTLQLYSSTVVRDEVPEKIQMKAKDLKIADPAQALLLWETNYLPLIHFLDPDRLALLHVQVVIGDSDDAPTAQLITLLQPSVALSLDKKHLGEFQIVSDRKEWTKYAAAWRDQAQRDALVVSLYLGGGFAVSVSIDVVQRLFAVLARLDKRLLLAFAAVVGAAVLFPPTRRMLVRLIGGLAAFAQNEAIRGLLADSVALIVTKTAQAAQAKQFLLEKERGISQPTKVVEYLLLALSRAGSSLSAKELTRRIIDLGYQSRGKHPERYVRRLLGSSPEWFEQDDDGYWRIASAVQRGNEDEV
ncbi:MAG TPA: hypothetical protein VFV38_06075 [Ktedonobacteraceae bacterium]|nr:hypothetical protein [Ktedonobacteraceae bacterium]